MSDGVERMLTEIINDPQTEAWSFVAEGPGETAVSVGESDGSEETFTILPAVVLIQFAKATERDQKEFVRDVIEEFNDRKGAATAETGEFGGER